MSKPKKKQRRTPTKSLIVRGGALGPAGMKKLGVRNVLVAEIDPPADGADTSSVFWFVEQYRDGELVKYMPVDRVDAELLARIIEIQ